MRSQINPHFLFNALNALYGAIPREAAGARRMVLNLAEIFRYSLQSDKTFVPLAQEMQIVRAYLELEQCRLASRLDVQIEVDDAALQIPIPALSIQPLVENAVKHGVALRIEPGYVRIKAQCRNERIADFRGEQRQRARHGGSGHGRRPAKCQAEAGDLLRRGRGSALFAGHGVHHRRNPHPDAGQPEVVLNPPQPSTISWGGPQARHARQNNPLDKRSRKLSDWSVVSQIRTSGPREFTSTRGA